MMSDGIETLRAFLLGCEPNLGIGCERELGALARLVAERDSLRKALDDRYEADRKAAKAIFAETGRTSGFPSVREVVAWYVAELDASERRYNEAIEEGAMKICDAESDNNSLRAKLERAKWALETLFYWYDADGSVGASSLAFEETRTVLAELSADASEVSYTAERDSLRAELERATRFVRNVSSQHLTSEMDAEDIESASFEDGYEIIVRGARAVIAELSADAPAQRSKKDVWSATDPIVNWQWGTIAPAQQMQNGFVVAPEDATKEMLLRGSEAIEDNIDQLQGTDEPGPTIYDQMVLARAAYEAMIDAIHKLGGDGRWPVWPRVRHKKRGSTYRVIGCGELQSSAPIEEGAVLVVYQCETDGRLWMRPATEFDDGRFEALTDAPAR